MNDTPTKEAGGPDQTGAPSTPPPCPICESPAPEFDMNKCREILSNLDIDSIERGLEKAGTVADNIEAEAAEMVQSGIASLETLEKIVNGLQALTKWAKAEDWKSFIKQAQAGMERIQALEPFLEDELSTIRQQPGYEAATLEYLESFIDLDGQTIADTSGGQPIPPFIREAIERAAAAVNKAEHPTATARRAEIIEMPLDKVNSTIWSMLQETTGNGQLKLWHIKVEKDGTGKELNVIYSIDFSKLEAAGVKITKQLMPYDKLVYTAISALFNAGNNVISLTQIYYAMGNTTKPSKYHIQRIQDSITKMTEARITVDNAQEVEVYKYKRFQYDGALLPIERGTWTINGQIAEAAIHIFREPPVMTFAKQRRQITTIPVKVLQSPISKTNANLLIQDYLIERIAHAKTGRQPKKILYSTLYEAAQITTKKQRERAPEKIKTYLDHFKACGEIKNYSMHKDFIQFEV